MSTHPSSPASSRAARLAPALETIDPQAVTISGLVLEPSYGPGSQAPSSGGTGVPPMGQGGTGVPPVSGRTAATIVPPAAKFPVTDSLANLDRDLPPPGQFPYTRGLFPAGYRTRLWTMRQFAGFGSADDTNRRFKYLLEQARFDGGPDLRAGRGSNTGLSTAFDLPTLMGRDSDDELSTGEVGKCGVAIDTIEDMHRLYDGIPIGNVTVSQTINGPAAVIWALYLAHALQRGVAWNTLGGTLQNDILKEFHSQNEFIYPPEPSVKLVVDTIEFQSALVPKWNSVSISGYHIREAGSTAVQELAFTLRDGLEYVEACLERGLPIDDFAPRLSFFFNSHNEFFEEICKLRAARRIWARCMRGRYGATSDRSLYMKTHVQTAGCSLTEQQPLNNIVRVAYQAMAAVLGGCQSLHTDSMDETLGLPTEQAVTVALRTQQILAYETGVTRTADPLGGSWFIENLTDTIEAGAIDLIDEIDRMGKYQSQGGTGVPPVSHGGTGVPPVSRGGTGVPPVSRGGTGVPPVTGLASHPGYDRRTGYARGVVNGINRGYFRRAIAEASYRFSEECEAGDRLIVGVNAFREENESRPIDILVIPHDVEVQQCERLAKFKKQRDKARVAKALENIHAACQGRPITLQHDLPGIGKVGGAVEAKLHATNVMPALIDASLAGATMGEMTQAMADIYGRYTGGPEW